MGGILILSGLSKILSINSFIDILNEKYSLGELSLLAPVIVIIEIKIGLSLLFLRNIQFNATLLIILLIFFTVFQTYVYINFEVSNCYCFGKLNLFGHEPLIFYIRNAILALMTSYLYFKPIQYTTRFKRVYTLILLTSVFFTGLNTDIKKTSIIINNFWYNSTDDTVNKTDSFQFIKEITLGLPIEKPYMLFFMTESCSYCLNSIENAKSFKEQNIVNQIVFVIVTNSSKVSPILSKYFNINEEEYTIKKISSNTFKKISETYPTTFIIKKDKSIIVHLGFLPSIPMFSKQHPELNLNNIH